MSFFRVGVAYVSILVGMLLGHYFHTGQVGMPVPDFIGMMVGGGVVLGLFVAFNGGKLPFGNWE